MSQEEISYFQEFLYGNGSTSSDDDAYKPEEPTDDEDEMEVIEQAESQNQSSLDLSIILERFADKTRIPTSQVFVTPLPKAEDLPGSKFTLPQWELLRHQSRLHFALLCNSLRCASYCASSDNILNGILAQIYSFYDTFEASVKATDYLNSLYKNELFVPVLGDPKKSIIHQSKNIINHFVKGKTLDDLIESQFFMDLLKCTPFGGERRPFITKHSAWGTEEEDLIRTAARRFSSPASIQKYVMPGRSIEFIEEHMKEEWIRRDDNEVQVKKPRQRGRPKQRTAEGEEQNEEQGENKGNEKMFVVKDGMKFDEIVNLSL